MWNQRAGTKRLRKNRKEGIIATEMKIKVFRRKEDKLVRGETKTALAAYKTNKQTKKYLSHSIGGLVFLQPPRQQTGKA